MKQIEYFYSKIAKLYGKNLTDLLPEEFTVSQNHNEIAIVQNFASISLSEKLIGQYEARISDLQEQLTYWKSKIK